MLVLGVKIVITPGLLIVIRVHSASKIKPFPYIRNYNTFYVGGFCEIWSVHAFSYARHVLHVSFTHEITYT